MKVKKIYTEAKKSRNFQTYTVGMEVEVNNDLEGEELEIITKKAQQKCRKRCMEQIEIDKQGV